MKKLLLIFSLLLLIFSTKASNYYWVGGTGNWSDHTHHWATTSGGLVFHIQIPSPADNVFFDLHSFPTANDTVFADSTFIYCKNMDWTGSLNNPVFTYPANTVTLKIYGSLTLCTGLTWHMSSIYFESTALGNTIKTNGSTLHSNNASLMYFRGIGSSWILQDSLITEYSIGIANGVQFSTNNQKINCYGFSNLGTANLGTSHIVCGYNNFTSNSQINAASSTIVLNNSPLNITGSVYNVIITNATNFSSSSLANVTVDSLIFYGNNNSYGFSFDTCNINQMIVQDYGYLLIMSGSGNVIKRLTSNGQAIISGNNTLARADFMNDVTISGNNTFDSLYFNNPGQTVRFGAGDTIIVNNILNVSGTCTGYTAIESTIPGQQSTISKSAGIVTCNYLILKDINATGGAVFTANNSINNGNVNGFTINSPASRILFWVGGTGNWSNPTHWSLTSGGAGGNCPPNQTDNVYFDVLSFSTTNDTVYTNQTFIYCKNMDWTGSTGNPVFRYSNNSSALKIYGSLTLNNNLTWDILNDIYFESTALGNTIKTNGAIFSYAGNTPTLHFKGVGSFWTLQDSLITSYIMVIDSGVHFNTNNQKVACYGFHNRGITDLGTSHLTCGVYDFKSNSHIDADSCTIILNQSRLDIIGGVYNIIISNNGSLLMHSLSNVSVDSLILNVENYIFAGNCIINQVIGQGVAVQISGSGNVITKLTSNAPTSITGDNTCVRADFMNDVTLSGHNIFDSLYFTNPSHTVHLGAGDTQNVNTILNVSGTCTGYITIESATSGQQSTILKSAGTVTGNYLILKDINATGGAVFTANNSINNGNVSGFIVNSPASRNLFWVGGTGNWNNPNHWSLTSGGAGGNCPPNQTDNLYFDIISFPSTNDTIYADSAFIYCNNMDWTSSTNNAVFKTLNNTTLKIYGSLILTGTMNWLMSDIYFESTALGNTIKTNGATLHSNNASLMYFRGIGSSWILQDSLITEYSIGIANGVQFSTNNQKINCYGFSNLGTANLGTSHIVCGYNNFKSNSQINAASSTIVLNNSPLNITGSVYNVIITNATNFSSSSLANVTVDSLIFYGNNNSYGFSFDTCSINQMIVQDYGYLLIMSGSGNVIKRLTSNGQAIISGNNTLARADFMNDVTISGNNTFDSLYFNNPGHTVLLGAGDTLTVHNDMQINGNGSFPVTIQSTIPGTQAIVSKATDTVCTNFIYLQDIIGSGGAAFFAGGNSFDLGNNSGWQFANCSQPISNVWPGDANYDLVANNIDILYIGLAYNETGFVRPGATIAWNAEPCIDWFSQFNTGVNAKNADCDGNGIVNSNDTTAVAQNYTLTHPAIPIYNGIDNRNTNNLFVDVPSGTLHQGDVVSVPVKFGTPASPVTDVYGIAFTVNYDKNLIENGSMSVTYANSWLVTPANNVHLEKNFPATGSLDIGFSRTNHQNQSGDGTIAFLNFTVGTATTGTLIFNLSTILSVSNTGIPIPVVPLPDSVTVIAGINAIVNDHPFSLFPNPAGDYTYLDYFMNASENVKITITSLQGEQIKSISLQKNIQGMHHQKIETSDIPAGIYFCTLKTSDRQISKRLVIVK